jgi:hypothetical protein
MLVWIRTTGQHQRCGIAGSGGESGDDRRSEIRAR